MHGLPSGILRPPRPRSQAEPEGEEAELPAYKWLGQAPGTMVLVIVFFASFVTYYFANWKLLSFLWKLG